MRCDRAADAMPRAVPLTAEQWRDRRAQQRAADEAQGILHRPAGRLPAGHHWDMQQGVVLDEDAAASASSAPVAQVDVPFDDALFEWAVQHAPPRLSAHGEDRKAWDAEREPWVLRLMGKPLPVYGEGGDNERRSTAWEAALHRHAKAVAACERRAVRRRVTVAQELRRQRVAVVESLWRAQRFFAELMPRDPRYRAELEMHMLLAEAADAVRRLRERGYVLHSYEATEAAALLCDVQALAFPALAVGECAKELTRFAAQARWAADHAPDGSRLWWEGQWLASEHAVAEWRTAGGYAICDWGPCHDGLAWRTLPMAQKLQRPRQLEYVLDQESMRLLRMAPPPALLRWLRESMAVPLPAIREAPPAPELDGPEDEEATKEPLGDATWASGAWDALPSGSREAALLLGFNRVRWDASPRRVFASWEELSADEHTAAVRLGVAPAEWDALLAPLPTRTVPLISGTTQGWVDGYIVEAEHLEQRARDVRAHPFPNRVREPNVRTDDAMLRRHREVRVAEAGSSDASPGLRLFPRRVRAWAYYELAEAPPLPVDDEGVIARLRDAMQIDDVCEDAADEASMHASEARARAQQHVSTVAPGVCAAMQGPAHLRMLDAPEVTGLCMYCGELRPGEQGLSRVESQPDGSLRRVGAAYCRRCVQTSSE